MSNFFHQNQNFFHDWPINLSIITPFSLLIWASNVWFSHSSSYFNIRIFIKWMESFKPFFKDSKLHNGVTFFSFIILQFYCCLLPLIASDLISKNRSLLCMNASNHNRLWHASKHLSKQKNTSNFDVTWNIHEDFT